MAFANHVKIGPEFFSKAFNDYANWKWAIVREFMQNSMDCSSDIIRVNVSLDDNGDTLLVVENNGSPMTKEILVDKLFALGGSGKNFNGTVGGFGKAKELLYFCHKFYNIQSGDFVVAGCGAGYDISEAESYFDGTRSTILISGDYVDKLNNYFRVFASFAQWSGRFFLNGEEIDLCLRKGSPRREFDFGIVYTNKSFPNTLIVRINGIPMFWNSISYDRCVILELSGSSVDVLTSNRDGLNYSYRDRLSSFITEIAVDKRSALKNRNSVRYRKFEGEKMTHHVNKSLNVKSVVDVGSVILRPTVSLVDAGGGSVALSDYRDVVIEESAAGVMNISEEFIIKNETELKVPNYYLPDSSEFSEYSRKLVRMWGRLMLELHRLFEHESEFAIGFVFDDMCEAQFENDVYGKVYYLSPAKVVEQAGSSSKSFKKRFLLTERNRLLMIALHEFVHGIGYGPHDEDYASKFTDMAWKVMNDRKRFNWCFE